MRKALLFVNIVFILRYFGYCSLQVRFNVVQYVVPEVKELYNWLEVDFHPLKLCSRVSKVGFVFSSTQWKKFIHISGVLCKDVLLGMFWKGLSMEMMLSLTLLKNEGVGKHVPASGPCEVEK